MTHSPYVGLALTDKGFLKVTLDRPKARNALNIGMLQSLAGAMRDAESLGARAILLTSNGAAVFSSGGDLSDLEERREEQHEALVDFVAAFADAPVPVLCAQSGRALGAGAIPALLADVTLLSADARLEFPEIGFGLLPVMMIEVLAERIGLPEAITIGLSGRGLSASDALAIGIASEIAEASVFSDGVWVEERVGFYAERQLAVSLARNLRRRSPSVRSRVERSGIGIALQLDAARKLDS